MPNAIRHGENIAAFPRSPTAPDSTLPRDAAAILAPMPLTSRQHHSPQRAASPNIDGASKRKENTRVVHISETHAARRTPRANMHSKTTIGRFWRVGADRLLLLLVPGSDSARRSAHAHGHRPKSGDVTVPINTSRAVHENGSNAATNVR